MNKFELFLTIFMFARAVIAVIDGLRNSPVKRLKAIRKAEEENCVTTAKISCNTLNGTYKHYTQQVEYVYKVNDELYFLTYELNRDMLDSNEKKPLFKKGPLAKLCKQDRINEAQLVDLGRTVTVYYDRRKPKKAYTKQEVFVDSGALIRRKTPKENPHRNIGGTWYQPVDLRTADTGRK